jgi:uncharacterized protein
MRSRPIIAADHAALLRLNAESVQALSPLDAHSLEALLGACSYGQAIEDGGELLAFVIALAPGADYASPNYRWFEARGGRFLYVDRVVVAAQARRRGLGRQLYAELFEFACAEGFEEVVCEFDLDPPNPASASFHAGFGFREIGQQTVRGKRVSMQAARLDRHAH